MAQSKILFPVFEVPTVKKAGAADLAPKGSLYFDYAKGDFRRDGANRVTPSNAADAYIQWCVKAVQTERGSCLAYGDEYGVELEAALAQPDRGAVESELERTITEALTVDPRTEYVRGFSFLWEGDALRCEFIVKGRDWDEMGIGVSYAK